MQSSLRDRNRECHAERCQTRIQECGMKEMRKGVSKGHPKKAMCKKCKFMNGIPSSVFVVAVAKQCKVNAVPSR